MEQLTDHQLIASHKKGDTKAFEALVNRYMNQVFRFVFRYVADGALAEDITQEVFLKVYRNIKKVDKNKSFKSWIYTIAKNTALDHLKKKKAIPFSRFEQESGRNILFDVLPDGAPLPLALSQMRETRDVFSAAISQLSSKYKTVLSLYYYQYLNFREIAETLQEPINTIKSRHRRGLALLRQTIR